MNKQLNELISRVTTEMESIAEKARADWFSPSALRWAELKTARAMLVSAAEYLGKAAQEQTNE